MAEAADFDALYGEHRGYLWGLCYRMTSSAADADDLVQDTFTRAFTNPPADTSRPWRPWLTRVATNLSIDCLRRRKKAKYVGPWLPEPIDTDELAERVYEPPGTEGRYELLESVSFAFLLALETLSPTGRAVLLLRDVFDYSSAEVAELLELSDANVRQTLGRARKAMAAYDRTRQPITEPLQQRTAEVLGRFLQHLQAGDAAGMEKLLAEDVVLTNDSNGVFHAARKPVVGAAKVARFHLKVARDELPRVAVRMLNGLPAIVGEFDTAPEGFARRFVTLGWLDADGRIAEIHGIVAPAKLGTLGVPEA